MTDEAAANQKKVAPLIATAFRTSVLSAGELHQEWIRASFKIGLLLPNSLLSLNIQQCGELDMLLRKLEKEHSDTSSDEEFSYHYLSLLSGIWIGLIYEIFRLLRERRLIQSNSDFDKIAHHLRLIRISLEKHEIAADKKIADHLVLTRSPPNNDETDFHLYTKTDPTRAHIMPMGVSARGSAMWAVTDVEANQSYWLERLTLSEQIIHLWSDPPTK